MLNDLSIALGWRDRTEERVHVFLEQCVIGEGSQDRCRQLGTHGLKDRRDFSPGSVHFDGCSSRKSFSVRQLPLLEYLSIAHRERLLVVVIAHIVNVREALLLLLLRLL